MALTNLTREAVAVLPGAVRRTFYLQVVTPWGGLMSQPVEVTMPGLDKLSEAKFRLFVDVDGKPYFVGVLPTSPE